MTGRYDLGILVVHGIGGQRRGDTLAEVAEPLVQSLIDWLGEDAVEVRETELAQASAGCPAHVTVIVKRGTDVRRVLIAESWWADTFHPPGWWALVSWLFWAVPFVIFRAADHGISVNDTNEKLDDARSSQRWRGWARVPWYVGVRLVKNAASVALVLAVVLLLLVASPVALVPRVRASIVSAQRVLIRYIGDSYTLLLKPIQADATISQVERDLRWLRRQMTQGKVAIIAHSQGAELVRRVLARGKPTRPIDTLITYGAGIAKLRAVARLYAQRWQGLRAYAMRVVAAALTVAGPLLAITAELSTVVTVLIVVAAVGSAALMLTRARDVLRSIVRADLLAGDLRAAAEAGKVRRWLDFYATSDPVPEGGMPVHRLGLDAASSTRIANYRSPIRDHTSYSKNGEAFRPAVLAELARLLGWTLAPAAMVVVHNARERRARRTRALVTDRIVLLGALAAMCVLWSFDLRREFTDDVTSRLLDAAGWVAGWFSDSAATWLEAPVRREAVAGAVLVVAAGAVYAVCAWLWSLSAARRARRLFRADEPPGAEPLPAPAPFVQRFAYERLARHAKKIDDTHGWPQHPRRLRWLLPKLRGELVLLGLRHRLRERNLYDEPATDPPARVKLIPRAKARSVDGTETDVDYPAMGAAGTHFGRNGPAFPPCEHAPSAAVVSEKLLARKEFLPAESLNLLAAAWLQFEVHDWIQHRPRRHWRPGDHPHGPLDPDTPPFQQTDPSRTGAPRFVSDQTHWWDASQLYGVDPVFTTSIRAEGGRVKTGTPLLEAIEDSIDSTGSRPAPVPNFWLGLALFHELFALEHNAICDALQEAHPDLQDDALFHKARLVNAALMAKIHTVEWTPAVIANKLTEKAILASWWGLLGERTRKRVGRVGREEVLSGIPGSRTHHDGVRYSLTEEFVAVYRMHPLIPDEVTFRSLTKCGPSHTFEFVQLAVGAGPARGPRDRLHEVGGVANALYSLAVECPGQITLHNYPQALRTLKLPGDDQLDLAKRDIERTREAALPRYNDFRRVFHMTPVTSFDDLNPKLAGDLGKVYNGVEDVDLMVGLFAEPPPQGFAFSDTAFRVFLLMAARRLRSDRFLTTDFTPAVYTPTGYRWVQDRTLKDMLVYHFPELEPRIPAGNVFKPWRSRP